MTLKEKFGKLFMKSRCTIEFEQIADEFAIGFAEWKDSNFSMYRDKTYYANTSSQYFDITKYVGKEKPTKYYTSKELLEIYKKENGL
jgi:hypothetical protein